jgi:hypothetical protein
MRILLPLLAAAAALACGASLTITNSTGGWDIMSVYVAPYGSTTWGADRLGDSLLAEGGELQLDLPAGVYAVRVIDEDGDTYTRLSIPVMTASVWEVTLDDLDGGYYSTGGSGG